MIEILILILVVAIVGGIISMILIQSSQRKLIGSVVPPRFPEDAVPFPPLIKDVKPRVTLQTPLKISDKTKTEFPIYYKYMNEKVLVGVAFNDIESAFDVQKEILKDLEHTGFNKGLYTIINGTEYKFH